METFLFIFVSNEGENGSIGICIKLLQTNAIKDEFKKKEVANDNFFLS